VPAGLPPAMVGTLHRLGRRLAGENDALELGIQRLCVRQRADHERGRKQVEQRQLRWVACGPAGSPAVGHVVCSPIRWREDILTLLRTEFLAPTFRALQRAREIAAR